MARQAKKKKDANEEKVATPLDIINAYLNDKDNKKLHYNHMEEIYYKISSGSLNLDLELGGGFPSGIHRLEGPEESGKTSCALSVAKHFQEYFGDKSMFVYIKAEGRLTPEIIARSGIDISPERFFCFDTNVIEAAFGMIKNLIFKNETNTRFMFFIDSMDGLNRQADLDKAFTESDQVAGGALVSSVFLKKMALPLVKHSHMLFFTSQVRSKISANGMGGSGSPESSGGNAWKHYSNFILQFKKRYSNDIMYEFPEKKKVSEKGRPLGHKCKIEFKKSINEKTGVNMDYPIIYGRTGGRSIWIEREIIDLCFSWGFFEKSGSWIKVDDEIIKILKENNLEFIDKIQGEDNLCKELEKNEAVTNFLFQYCKDEVGKLTAA
jgi:RecA/RadA recombinase